MEAKTYTPEDQTAKDCIRMIAVDIANPNITPETTTKNVVQHIIKTDMTGWICNDPTDPTFKAVVNWAVMAMQEVTEFVRDAIVYTIK
jgi:hypothetical protein